MEPPLGPGGLLTWLAGVKLSRWSHPGAWGPPLASVTTPMALPGPLQPLVIGSCTHAHCAETPSALRGLSRSYRLQCLQGPSLSGNTMQGCPGCSAKPRPADLCHARVLTFASWGSALPRFSTPAGNLTQFPFPNCLLFAHPKGFPTLLWFLRAVAVPLGAPQGVDSFRVAPGVLRSWLEGKFQGRSHCGVRCSGLQGPWEGLAWEQDRWHGGCQCGLWFPAWVRGCPQKVPAGSDHSPAVLKQERGF